MKILLSKEEIANILKEYLKESLHIDAGVKLVEDGAELTTCIADLHKSQNVKEEIEVAPAVNKVINKVADSALSTLNAVDSVSDKVTDIFK